MNTFGSVLRMSIYGESHGPAVGVLLDGCPAGIPIRKEDFMADMERRRAGKPGTTPRVEDDRPEIISGVFNGTSTGSPIHLTIKNRHTRPPDYDEIRVHPRPGREDLAARLKFGGFEDFRGGGHFSGRLTAGLVAVGVIAKKLLAPIGVRAELVDEEKVRGLALEAEREGDSVGGIVACTVAGCPAGWGEPFFDSTESLLAHMLFSIPGVKGLEFGVGFNAGTMKGSEYNDPILNRKGKTESNNTGGIVGGLTNGNDLFFRVVLRPAGSIARPQKTINLQTGHVEAVVFKGRHDACFALRVPVVVEAATAFVLADLRLQTFASSRNLYGERHFG